MTYTPLASKDAKKFLDALDKKSKRIVMDKLKLLKNDPYQGQGQGDKELIDPEYGIYRLHISKSYTAFYQILEEDKTVRVLDIMTIEQAHKLYGRFEKGIR